jgi:hypothetical protein
MVYIYIYFLLSSLFILLLLTRFSASYYYYYNSYSFCHRLESTHARDAIYDIISTSYFHLKSPVINMIQKLSTLATERVGRKHSASRSSVPDEPPTYNALFPDCEKGLKASFNWLSFGSFLFLMILEAFCSIYLVVSLSDACPSFLLRNLELCDLFRTELLQRLESRAGRGLAAACLALPYPPLYCHTLP